MNYIWLLDENLTVSVRQGMDEVSESTAEMTVKEGIAMANDDDTGRFHPDIYTIITYKGFSVNYVVSANGNEIIGFTETEVLPER